MNGGSLLLNQKESTQTTDMFSASAKVRKFGMIGPILISIHFHSLGAMK